MPKSFNAKKFSMWYNAFCNSAYTASRGLAMINNPETVPVDWARLTTNILPDPAMKLAGKDVTRAGMTGWEVGESDKVVLYLHGGGYLIGNTKFMRPLARRLCDKGGFRVVGVDYRLAPEHPLPAATEDAVNTYKSLLDEGCRRICIAGDSAGGGLTLLTLQRLREEGIPMPSCAVTISPFADLTLSGESFTTNDATDVLIGGFPRATVKAVIKMAVGGNDPFDATYSPLHGSFEGFPPLKVMVGDTEILLSDAMQVASKAHSQGVTVDLEIAEGMCHSYPIFSPLFPEASAGAESIIKFIDKYI